ncbi:predicted protein [Brucella pinnipedialis M163/99/10]|uniref:Uncharacterized protein n=6 Tax=Brucella TaxID=234 RepID=C0RJH9_BRUMB|nr:Hypothetical protein, conserved [Brucella canis ATCC 23365]ABY38311.1 Hypothetical protein, conserved [Brucella suis ATCC 23445]ACO00987.1 Hypothetical protein, conserved [Brucella melitensis ATCC 23457]ADZ87156.1 conserved hypothetical protein [Brucella melitensis M5-90]EEH14733.1 Hypothetical protein, conserved [Brucella ceti str. Cudo]EEX91215.1 predicted protein [Brucella ceti M13/05/1]EEX98239.1 predicted protein [Brucella ceti M644/93/1]EEY00564.1 predicted protein [Brucella pinnipe
MPRLFSLSYKKIHLADAINQTALNDRYRPLSISAATRRSKPVEVAQSLTESPEKVNS